VVQNKRDETAEWGRGYSRMERMAADHNISVQ